MRQVAHRGLHLGYIHSELTVGRELERSLVFKVVELKRHALAVRLIYTEAKCAEGGSEEGGVKLPLGVLAGGQQIFIQHVLQHEQAANIRLRFFDRAIEFLQFLSGSRLPY